MKWNLSQEFKGGLTSENQLMQSHNHLHEISKIGVSVETGYRLWLPRDEAGWREQQV